VTFCVGLDLGQSADYTALAVVENVGERGQDHEVMALHLRHLERYPLRTPYPEIADRVDALVRDPKLATTTQRRIGRDQAALADVQTEVRHKKPDLVVDATGLGVAVIDLLRERRLSFRAVTITGGDKAHYSGEGRSYRVPKRDLVAALEVPFHTGELKVAEGLTLWRVLREELLTFRRKINLKTAHDSYEHWRESDHDDLVLACALACWWARRGALLPTPKSRRPKGAPTFPKPPLTEPRR
jgi:hypothetical protein